MGFFLKWAASLLFIGLLLSTHIVFSKWAELTSHRLHAVKANMQTKNIQSLSRPQTSTPVQVRKILTHYDRKMFFKHLRTRFPKYQEHFHNAAQKHDLPWKLLASQAYQESHWNRRARSPTGVRGIMMLTRSTAASLGIRNRLDPMKSIHGGAEYLAIMQKRIPTDVPIPDRRFFALAAYNVGLGHIKDARTLARKKSKDPDRWQDIMQVLPLLSQKKYHRTLQHGYARGEEPVTYVQRIRAYQVLLDQMVSENYFETKGNEPGKRKEFFADQNIRPFHRPFKEDTRV